MVVILVITNPPCSLCIRPWSPRSTQVLWSKHRCESAKWLTQMTSASWMGAPAPRGSPPVLTDAVNGQNNRMVNAYVELTWLRVIITTCWGSSSHDRDGKDEQQYQMVDWQDWFDMPRPFWQYGFNCDERCIRYHIRSVVWDGWDQTVLVNGWCWATSSKHRKAIVVNDYIYIYIYCSRNSQPIQYIICRVGINDHMYLVTRFLRVSTTEEPLGSNGSAV